MKSVYTHHEEHSSLSQESWCTVWEEAWHKGESWFEGRVLEWHAVERAPALSLGKVAPAPFWSATPVGTSTFTFWCASRAHFWSQSPAHPHLPRFGLPGSGEYTKCMQMAQKQKTGARSASDAFWMLMRPSVHRPRLEGIWRKTYGNVWTSFRSSAPTDRIRLIHVTC